MYILVLRTLNKEFGKFVYLNSFGLLCNCILCYCSFMFIILVYTSVHVLLTQGKASYTMDLTK